jgi:ssDNA-binding replication factor A large subunit
MRGLGIKSLTGKRGGMQSAAEALAKKYTGEQVEWMVSDLVRKYSGLLTHEAALRVIAKREGLFGNEPLLLSDIRPDMANASFGATVTRIFPQLASADGKRKSVRMFVSDSSGELTLVLWNEQAKLVDGAIGIGDRVTVEGAYMRGGELYLKYSGKISVQEPAKARGVKELLEGLNNCIGKVKSINLDYYFVRDGKERVMSSFVLEDQTGEVRVVVWSETAKVKELGAGDAVKIENALFKNTELHVNLYSRIVRLARAVREDVVSGEVESYAFEEGRVIALIDGKSVVFEGKLVLQFLEASNIPADVKVETVAMLKASALVGKKVNVKVKNEKGKLFAEEFVN